MLIEETVASCELKAASQSENTGSGDEASESKATTAASDGGERERDVDDRKEELYTESKREIEKERGGRERRRSVCIQREKERWCKSKRDMVSRRRRLRER